MTYCEPTLTTVGSRTPSESGQVDGVGTRIGSAAGVSGIVVFGSSRAAVASAGPTTSSVERSTGAKGEPSYVTPSSSSALVSQLAVTGVPFVARRSPPSVSISVFEAPGSRQLASGKPSKYDLSSREQAAAVPGTVRPPARTATSGTRRRSICALFGCCARPLEPRPRYVAHGRASAGTQV